MAVETDKMNRMLAAIGSGVTKDKYPFTLTPEESEAWDTLEAEVADIKGRGLIVDVPGEWPSPHDKPGGAPAPAADGPGPAEPAAPPAAPAPASTP